MDLYRVEVRRSDKSCIGNGSDRYIGGSDCGDGCVRIGVTVFL